MYLWNFKLLDEVKELYYELMEGFMAFGDISIKITGTVGIGAALAIGMQILILICSIVLLTCKNRKKVQA